MRKLTLTNHVQSDTTVLENEFIDHYMAEANGEYVKVYLILLRHLNEPSGTLTISKIADLLDITEKDVIRALNYWKKKGLLDYDMPVDGETPAIPAQPRMTEEPSAPVVNALKDAGYDVISVGKINDIFVGEGITESNHSDSSVHGMQQTIDIAKRDFKGLCFTNLVDFDALWGHRRNPVGYGEEIEKFDKKLGELLPLLREDDLLILTADHGNDPTYKGTDHTREQVPFIAYSPSDTESGKLDTSDTFAVIGATIADNFGVKMPEGTIGTSILDQIK